MSLFTIDTPTLNDLPRVCCGLSGCAQDTRATLSHPATQGKRVLVMWGNAPMLFCWVGKAHFLQWCGKAMLARLPSGRLVIVLFCPHTGLKQWLSAEHTKLLVSITEALGFANLVREQEFIYGLNINAYVWGWERTHTDFQQPSNHYI